MSHYNLFAADESGERPNAHEAEAYHDGINRMIHDEGYFPLVAHDTRQAMIVVRDTLCWLLGHDDNPTFQENLQDWAEDYREFLGSSQKFDN